MPYRSLFLTLLLFLTGCAYGIEGTSREVTVITPGAQDALCIVMADGLRYKFHPPQTWHLPQSHEDLVVDCKAPGNRQKKLIIDPDYSVYGFFNIANAGVGLAWDVLSGAMFVYPRVIEVDFRDVPVRPMPLPAHNNPDIMQPEERELEEFLPSHPALNKDKYAPVSRLKRRQVSGGETSSSSGVATPVSGKGDLMTVIKDLRNNIDPAASAPSPTPLSSGPEPLSSGSPVPLFPGE